MPGCHHLCPWALTHKIAMVPEPSIVLGREEPPDHPLPHPLVVHTQRQHAQPILVVSGEGVAVLPGAWGQTCGVTGLSRCRTAGHGGAKWELTPQGHAHLSSLPPDST